MTIVVVVVVVVLLLTIAVETVDIEVVGLPHPSTAARYRLWSPTFVRMLVAFLIFVVFNHVCLAIIWENCNSNRRDTFGIYGSGSCRQIHQVTARCSVARARLAGFAIVVAY